MSDKYHRVIGIDLGTTYSAVAAHDTFAEQAEVLANPEDNQQTVPSVVSRDPRSGRVLVGWQAKRNVAFDPRNTIIEIKREMGERFTPETLAKFGAQDVFRARDDAPGGHPGDPVKVRFLDEWFMPQEISALILMRMKEIAESHIGEPIHDAVVTVPAYFTERQKKATEEAALLAGLYPRQLIPEPTAAAICYGVDRMEADRHHYLVYDLGGGTFDVSIISVEETNIDVIATSGDPRLGGGDFDDRIVHWAVDELRQQFGIEVGMDRELRARLKLIAEECKKQLAAYSSAAMPLGDLWPEQSPTLELTRERFEELIDDLLNKSLNYVDTAIAAAGNKGIRREDIDAILLVGGSSKIPRVKTKLLEYFEQDEDFVRADLNPDIVVARGAAIMAQRFLPTPGGFKLESRPDSTLVNREIAEEMNVGLITEHSLGIGVQNNLVVRIIEQGTNIPVAKKQGGFTNAGPTDHVDVPVYQGEGDYTYENTLIGTLRIGPMEPKPEGFHQFEVTFALDANGLLALTVHHINESKTYQTTLQQETAVGGMEALDAVRNKLLKLYLPLTAGGAATPETPTPEIPTQPVAPPESIATSGAAPSAANPPTTGTAADAPTAPPASEPAATNPPSHDVSQSDGVIEPQGEVPDEFKSIVRRARKLLLQKPHPKLLEAFNRFTSLLNDGADPDELTDAGDELADVYHDCR